MKPSKGVLKKTCSEDMKQIYRETPMVKCHFNNVFNLEHLWKAAFEYNKTDYSISIKFYYSPNLKFKKI